jgi:hypothetical protein
VQIGGIGPRIIVTHDGFELTDKRISNHENTLCFKKSLFLNRF